MQNFIPYENLQAATHKTTNPERPGYPPFLPHSSLHPSLQDFYF